jgi:uncharacterized protein (DUF1697 family)
MAVVISMLRGVNIGGHHKIRMEELRAIYESLKLRDAETHMQSGNVVFRTAKRDTAQLARRIEKAIEKEFGFRPPVILRSTAELRRVVERNPFASRKGIEPSKLAVMFLESDPGKEIRKKVLALKTDPEELRMEGRELYMYFPNGMARPKLSIPTIERILKTPGTGRSWNSVQKLLEIAKGMEAGGAIKRDRPHKALALDDKAGMRRRLQGLKAQESKKAFAPGLKAPAS